MERAGTGAVLGEMPCAEAHSSLRILGGEPQGMCRTVIVDGIASVEQRLVGLKWDPTPY